MRTVPLVASSTALRTPSTTPVPALSTVVSSGTTSTTVRPWLLDPAPAERTPVTHQAASPAQRPGVGRAHPGDASGGLGRGVALTFGDQDLHRGQHSGADAAVAKLLE